ncbi:DUF159 family protein [Halobacteriales archaeon SW_7_68_16]|nr:MAG: DUF159 family protein [Halobacteriales archaeon SW_7_68_16]
MMGRYTRTTDHDRLVERFGATVDRRIEPTYNLAPTDSTPVVTDAAPERFRWFRWGLPGDDGPIINARVETVAGRFPGAVGNRCLVPVDGFYEWPDDGPPRRVAFADDRPFAVAGIYDRVERTVEQVGLDAFGGDDDPGPTTETVEAVAILTTEPNDVVAPLHHRMAVVLPPDRERAWLDDDLDPAAVADPYPGDEMTAHAVDPAVGDPSVDRSGLLDADDGT